MKRKYLINKINKIVDKCQKVKLEYGYLNIGDPIIKIKKLNDEYYLIYKNMIDSKNDLYYEYDLPITLECYEMLVKNVIDNIIYKDRYIVPLNSSRKAKVDIYHGKLEGLKVAEVIFTKQEDYDEFEKPDWFDQEITLNLKYQDSNLSKIENI